MSTNTVTLQIDGKEITAPVGAMLIEITDREKIEVPRFCYHKKLSVAANCRMCLVDVEANQLKPLPACATPVAEGMKVWTRSKRACDAQSSTMEFLLINHPLDCPICDQGGECELQDVSMAYGDSGSRFFEEKRIVIDKDIGPLVSTEMTRCIQCTRCVRFGEEIAGMREMGATGRGERMEIGTFVEQSLTSELSANIIDICPVGALTAKPSRYKARAWEMLQHKTIASHDSVGSNLYVHTFDKDIIRAAPRENEAVNECWISDRDRFSYQGLDHPDRLTKPQIKYGGQWRVVPWEKALQETANILKNSDAEKVGVLASPRATIEELFLLQKAMRGIGINNIDHRLRQTDFSDQQNLPLAPTLGVKIAELAQQQAVLLIGSNIRKEQPMLNHRLRQAALNGATIMTVNPYEIDFNYDVATQHVTAPSAMVNTLANLAAASGRRLPPVLQKHVKNSDENIQNIVKALKKADNSLLLLGNISIQHPDYALLRAFSSIIAFNTKSKLGQLTASANTVGANLAGVLPHRIDSGIPSEIIGKNTVEMLNADMETFVLFDIEPEFDLDNPALATKALSQTKKVIAITAYANDNLKQQADILLPISTFTETAGTFVNTEGTWQSFKPVTKLKGDARPGWKVLRVLGNHLKVAGFDYVTSLEVRADLRWSIEEGIDSPYKIATDLKKQQTETTHHLQRIGETQTHAIDNIVRRATALQQTVSDKQKGAKLHPTDMQRLNFSDGETVTATQGDASIQITVFTDKHIPIGCVFIASGTKNSAKLGSAFGTVELTK